MPTYERFGEQLPYCEPYWYQGFPTVYYTEKHVEFRNKVRAFVDKEVRPNVNKWIESPDGYPKELHEKIYQAGISSIIYPPECGGTRPPDYDAFYELILMDELARVGGGHALAQLGINSMALPPVLKAGPPHLRDKVARAVITGKEAICLAISEPYAGSDVSALRATAVKSPCGKKYIVNGQKKWITGGHFADWFTLAVRTGDQDSGAGGLTLLLVPRHLPGIQVRKMPTQFDTSHSTTFVTFSDVEVPCENIIGEEGAGFMLLLLNFNHERFVIAGGMARSARICYELSLKYAMKRETFGRKLASHQVIRAKLAEMSRQIEQLHDMLERTAYMYSQGVPDTRMGGHCAFLKVNASRTFEFCAREASQIFGGAAVVREGQGQVIERLYREVRAGAIPGGSEEILLDFAMRQAIAKGKQLASSSSTAKL